MKKIMMMVAMLVIFAVGFCGVTHAESAMIDYVVEYINEQANTIQVINSCFYSEDADVVVMKLDFVRTMKEFNDLDDKMREEIISVYDDADKILVDALKLAGCDVQTETIAFTSDGQAFFVAINGVNLTEEIFG